MIVFQAPPPRFRVGDKLFVHRVEAEEYLLGLHAYPRPDRGTALPAAVADTKSGKTIPLADILPRWHAAGKYLWVKG